MSDKSTKYAQLSRTRSQFSFGNKKADDSNGESAKLINISGIIKDKTYTDEFINTMIDEFIKNKEYDINSRYYENDLFNEFQESCLLWMAVSCNRLDVVKHLIESANATVALLDAVIKYL